MVAQYVMVEDADITVNVDAPAVLTSGAISHSLEVTSSGKITVDTKKAALNSDMISQTPKTGLGYTRTATPPYVGGTLTWGGSLSGAAIATKVKKDGSGVVLDTNGGTTVFSVTTPAQQATTPFLVDDNTEYSGIWSITNSGQIKLDVDET